MPPLRPLGSTETDDLSAERRGEPPQYQGEQASQIASRGVTLPIAVPVRARPAASQDRADGGYGSPGQPATLGGRPDRVRRMHRESRLE